MTTVAEILDNLSDEISFSSDKIRAESIVGNTNLRLGWCILIHARAALGMFPYSDLRSHRAVCDKRGRSLACQSVRIARYLKSHGLERIDRKNAS